MIMGARAKFDCWGFGPDQLSTLNVLRIRNPLSEK